MKGKLGFRILFSVIFLAVFGIYSYKHFSSGWFTVDTADWGPAGGLNAQGVESIDMYAQKEEEPTPETEATPEPTPEPTEDPLAGLPKVDLASWEMLLVNKASTLDQNYEPTIGYAGDNDCPVDERIVEPLEAFAQGCKDAGLPVFLSSGYRSYSEQQYLYQRKIGQGYTPEQAAEIVAIPGTSEHQSGLCCDITDRYRELKDASIAETETYKWLLAHCHEYGFILRFPEDKTDITEIMYEPWHFRYVGIEAATYIMENGLCLEEFVELYNVDGLEVPAESSEA